MEIQSQHTSTFRDKKGGGVLFFKKEKWLNTALKPRTSVQTAFNKLETRYNKIARSVRQQIMVISLPCGLEGMGGGGVLHYALVDRSGATGSKFHITNYMTNNNHHHH